MKKYYDYIDYIENFIDEKDLILLDSPWKYNDFGILKKTQLNYNLWIDNDKELEFIFNKVRTKYLFIWVTNSMILNVLKCKHYDYIYKTQVIWVKKTKNDKVFYGLGNYFRGCTESLLIFSHKNSSPLRFTDRNIIFEKAGKKTLKPKNFELYIFNKFQDLGFFKFSYIFSGENIQSFENLNIDVVDILFKN